MFWQLIQEANYLELLEGRLAVSQKQFNSPKASFLVGWVFVSGSTPIQTHALRPCSVGHFLSKVTPLLGLELYSVRVGE